MISIRNIKTRKLSGLIAIILMIVSTLIVFSCDDSDDPMDPEPMGFDRLAMLASVADGLIIPNFERLQASTNVLSQSCDQFVADPSAVGLQLIQTAWEQMVMDFQHCTPFSFGPAGSFNQGNFTEAFGTFPLDEEQIEENIANASFDLPNSLDRDVRGVYALEYLIYGESLSVDELLNSYDQERLDYLTSIVQEFKSAVDQIVTDWKGSYRSSFSTDNSTSAGSAISSYYNEFVKDYETLKNFKVELPAGLAVGTSVDPNLVWGRYSGISNALVVEHFAGSKNIWFGRGRTGQQVIGFEEYLESVVGGTELASTTRSALDRIDQAIASLPESGLENNLENPAVVNLRDELQANTANFKSSLSSLLGISITFNSGDGD